MPGFRTHRRQLILLCGALIALMTSISPMQASQEDPPGEANCINNYIEGCVNDAGSCVSCSAYCANAGIHGKVCAVESAICSLDIQVCHNPARRVYEECACKDP